MNTDVRRAVFCCVMGAEDAADAFERLLRLGLKVGRPPRGEPSPGGGCEGRLPHVQGGCHSCLADQ